MHSAMRTLVCAFCLCGCAVSTVALARAGATDLTMRTLPNGVRVLVREQRATPLVAIDVWVQAGSAAELPGEAGAAHLLEHMLFKGTPTRKAGEIDFAIENLGGLLNAGTARDAAHVHTAVPVAHLGEALEVVADMVRHPAIDGVELEHERAVVLDELARDRNDTRRMATDLAMAGAFWGRPDAAPPGGAPETISRLTREAVAAFHARNYRPDRCIVALVGDVDVEAAVNLAARDFGDWKAADSAPGAAAATAHAGSGTAASSRRLEVDPAGRHSHPERLTGVCVALRPSGRATVEQYLALRMGAALLAFQGRGRAFDALARLGAGNVWSDVVPASAGFALVVYAEVKARDVEAALTALEGELARFGNVPLSQDDLEMARRRVLSQHLADMETDEGQARTLARFALLGDAPACLQADARLAGVDAGAFRAVFSANEGDPGEAIVPLPTGRSGR